MRAHPCRSGRRRAGRPPGWPPAVPRWPSRTAGTPPGGPAGSGPCFRGISRIDPSGPHPLKHTCFQVDRGGGVGGGNNSGSGRKWQRAQSGRQEVTACYFILGWQIYGTSKTHGVCFNGLRGPRPSPPIPKKWDNGSISF